MSSVLESLGTITQRDFLAKENSFSLVIKSNICAVPGRR